MTDDFFTMADAAQVKGVSYHTVARAARKGTIVTHRVGRAYLIARADLEAWQPMKQRAPKKYGRRTPNPDVTPLLVGEWS